MTCVTWVVAVAPWGSGVLGPVRKNPGEEKGQNLMSEKAGAGESVDNPEKEAADEPLDDYGKRLVRARRTAVLLGDCERGL